MGLRNRPKGLPRGRRPKPEVITFQVSREIWERARREGLSGAQMNAALPTVIAHAFWTSVVAAFVMDDPSRCNRRGTDHGYHKEGKT